MGTVIDEAAARRFEWLVDEAIESFTNGKTFTMPWGRAGAVRTMGG